jgi:hypothetical protein
MKLIKLVSDQAVVKSEFVDHFSIPLTLKENSQVALKSLSIEFQQPLYVIDSTNNLFIFKTISDGAEHQVQIPNGEYQINDLVRIINARMNNVLDENSDETLKKKRDFGLQWNVRKEVTVRDELKLVFIFSREASVAMNNSNTNPINMIYDSGTFTKGIADDGTYNASANLIPYINQGGFEISLTLTEENGGDIETANWILGCDTQSEALRFNTKSEITSKLLFGLSNSNGNYSALIGGVFVEQSIAIETNDEIRIHKREGKIIYNITKGSNTTVIQGDIINNFDKTKFLGANLNSFNIFVGDNGDEIGFSDIEFTPNPSVKVTNDVYEIVELPKEYVYYDLGAPVEIRPSLVSIDFPTVGVQKLLGFFVSKVEKNAKNGFFESDNSLQLNFFGGDDLLVEIPELASLNTYCHEFKQMRNVLISIPIADLRNAVAFEGGSFILSYSDTSNSIFIDLQNKFPLRVATMTVRVLTSKGKLLDCNGKMSCLLLHQ